eukprot:TRINITY_DN5017_c0_g1_i1.p1 TRINITY_DN5017_c0_g1~~TRINITY_DN5017_c0_g1_i1.p1  ORF type:complete len:119 (+),score=1.69 TRINITY_DN5017_c0_g1_i1:253-609(+)
MYSARDDANAPGFPIQKSTDQRVLSPPRSLSQSATSFIASRCQGIHQMLLICPYSALIPVSYTHLRAHETPEHLVCRLLLEKKKKNTIKNKTIQIELMKLSINTTNNFLISYYKKQQK